ncbi:MAG: hypothetical protein QOC93_62 [Actinomycetota bacterium]|nr:flavoprotein [Cryptosporangiaceae bacterium]MDQ1674918.1 hypothetical protein [Actinomycetota bacterium]
MCCAADGIEAVRAELVEPFLAAGWAVGVTATPTAYRWLTALGAVRPIEELTGLPLRHVPRLPGEDKPHPVPDGYLVAPATANTVAKLALGIADNQALTQLCEGLGGGLPVVVAPRVNAAHAGHPAWDGHLRTLRGAGVTVVTDPAWAAVRAAVGDLGSGTGR